MRWKVDFVIHNNTNGFSTDVFCFNPEWSKIATKMTHTGRQKRGDFG